MSKPDICEILEKMVPKPYFDWGGKQLGANGGYAKGSWDAGKESHERMFVFYKDIEFAKDCLRRDYEEPTESNALLKLCGSRRTGNRRFPRFGWLFPQQGCIIGRMEFLKHPGKTSAWQSLYALLARAPIELQLKESILTKIDGMEKCGESMKRVFGGTSPKFIRVRNHYQVQFSEDEMSAILPVLHEAAVPVQKFSSEETGLSDNLSGDVNESLGPSSWEQYHSTVKQKEIVDALSVIYRKFPKSRIKDCKLFADNQNFWETYDKLKHGVKGLEMEDLSMMVAHALAEMTKYVGKDGLTFFTGRTKIAKSGAISYIEDYGLVCEAREYYNKIYQPMLKPKKFVNREGREALTADGFEYVDMFAASLIKAMFGNGKGYGISGPVERLVKYANDMKVLAKNSPAHPRALPELNRFENAENLLLLLSDISVDKIKPFAKEYGSLVYAVFVSIFPNAYDRYEFIEDFSEFYNRNSVTDGRDANRKFNSRYKFLDEFAFKNKRKPSFTNCAILDMALRNGDMPEWSYAIMTAIYENAYGKDDENDYKAKSDRFPFARLVGLTKRDVVRYSYFVDDVEKHGAAHLQNAIRKFFEKFSQTKMPRTAPKEKLPQLTVKDNILVLEYDLRERAEHNDDISDDVSFEMACLRKNRTGLPVNIYVDDCGAWKEFEHTNRIKFQRDKGDRPVTRDLISMSIEDNPQILDKNPNMELSASDVNAVRSFVVANKVLLEKLGNTEIDIEDFIREMVRL